MGGAFIGEPCAYCKLGPRGPSDPRNSAHNRKTKIPAYKKRVKEWVGGCMFVKVL